MILILATWAAGFGMCGALGMVMGDTKNGVFFLGLLGVGISAVLIYFIQRLVKSGLPKPIKKAPKE